MIFFKSKIARYLQSKYWRLKWAVYWTPIYWFKNVRKSTAIGYKAYKNRGKMLDSETSLERSCRQREISKFVVLCNAKALGVKESDFFK